MLTLSWFFVAGCSRADTPCEKSAERARDLLEDCGVIFTNYHDDLNSRCTAEVQAIEECNLACYEQTSCSGYLGEDKDMALDLIICLGKCVELKPP